MSEEEGKGEMGGVNSVSSLKQFISNTGKLSTVGFIEGFTDFVLDLPLRLCL